MPSETTWHQIKKCAQYAVILSVTIAIGLLWLIYFSIPRKPFEFESDAIAQDGIGNFSTISVAIAAAPELGESFFVIDIKAGVYNEHVKVSAAKTKLVLIGDGVGHTILTTNRSVDHGWNIMGETATLEVKGAGFVARGLTFENSAAPQKGLAAAVVNEATDSVFYRCSFLSHQGTLYARLGKQFYRDCEIHGTVDIIFGNARAQFQDSSIKARRLLPGQRVVLTAQGKKKSTSKSGFVCQNCIIGAAPTFGSVKSPMVEVFLGRPWGPYATVVFMQSSMEDIVSPAGWLTLEGSLKERERVYFAEYENLGPGAQTQGRLKWPGYRLLQSEEALNFTVPKFLDGDVWLPATHVPYASGLD